MRESMNYQELYNLENDIDKQAEASQAFAFFFREKIKRFAIQNQHRLSVLHKTIEAIKHKYVKKDDNGKYLTHDVDGKLLWQFETEDEEKAYLKEWNEFMQITFDVNI